MMHDVKCRRPLSLYQVCTPCTHVARGHAVSRKGRCCFFVFALFCSVPRQFASLHPFGNLWPKSTVCAADMLNDECTSDDGD